MTNKDKFIEVFGIEPDTDICPVVCLMGEFECPSYREGICIAGGWWDLEYKGDKEN